MSPLREEKEGGRAQAGAPAFRPQQDREAGEEVRPKRDRDAPESVRPKPDPQESEGGRGSGVSRTRGRPDPLASRAPGVAFAASRAALAFAAPGGAVFAPPR